MAILEARGWSSITAGARSSTASLTVDAGEVVGLLGPNGAGKTTSFRMTTGQITPNDGQVVFNGQDVTALPMYQRARLGMGYLSQERASSASSPSSRTSSPFSKCCRGAAASAGS